MKLENTITLTPEEASLKAENLFTSGYTCSQAVLCTFCDCIGLSSDIAMKISSGFGGGIGRLREVCGTFSGMIMAYNMVKSSSSPLTVSEKTALYKGVQELAQRFIDANGSLICRELLGLVPIGTNANAVQAKNTQEHIKDSPVPEERTSEYYKKRPCAKLCGKAAFILAQYIHEFG